MNGTLVGFPAKAGIGQSCLRKDMKLKGWNEFKVMRNALGLVFLNGSATEAGAAESAVAAAITPSPARFLILLAVALFFFGFRWQKE